jgi:transcriptional regulator of arginine metabolism
MRYYAHETKGAILVMPVEQEVRHSRHRAILSILRRSAVRRQDELVERLRRLGFEVTQSSVSRDLRELGATKVGGRYVVPAAPEGEESAIEEVAHFLRTVKAAGPHLTLLLTAVGTAQAVAVALDRAGWPEVLGSIAGDDTIFVATSGAREQTRLLHRLGALLAKPAAGEA